MRNSRRVVITGLGVVAPNGIGKDAFWDALVAGRSGIADITLFDTTDYEIHVAGEVKGFDPSLYIEKKEIKKMDTFIHYAMAAAQFAMEDSALPVNDANRERIAVDGVAPEQHLDDAGQGHDAEGRVLHTRRRGIPVGGGEEREGLEAVLVPRQHEVDQLAGVALGLTDGALGRQVRRDEVGAAPAHGGGS